MGNLEGIKDEVRIEELPKDNSSRAHHDAEYLVHCLHALDEPVLVEDWKRVAAKRLKGSAEDACLVELDRKMFQNVSVAQMNISSSLMDADFLRNKLASLKEEYFLDAHRSENVKDV